MIRLNMNELENVIGGTVLTGTTQEYLKKAMILARCAKCTLEMFMEKLLPKLLPQNYNDPEVQTFSMQYWNLVGGPEFDKYMD